MTNINDGCISSPFIEPFRELQQLRHDFLRRMLAGVHDAILDQANNFRGEEPLPGWRAHESLEELQTAIIYLLQVSSTR